MKDKILAKHYNSVVLVTGGNGFIGRATVARLTENGVEVRSAVRRLANVRTEVLAPPLGSHADWRSVLDGVGTVIHTAARAHVLRDDAVDPVRIFREINLKGTLQLARQAAELGVNRFVFLSSIGVNGTQSTLPFNESHVCYPQEPYALSKLEAEQALLALGAQSGMEIVIIRPPLVYGPGAPGNFAGLIRWVQRGLPLPLGAIYNHRSLVALENLLSLVLLCADSARSPQAANQVFVVADGEDVSTSTLLRKVARASGRPSRLLPVPASWLRAGASLLGKRAVADRLLGNLQVDATKARTLLGWRPVITMDEQLTKMFDQES
jgi:nucleoside-diphosphate-sugar epimerase